MKRLLLSLMLAGGCLGVPAEAQSPFAKHERVLTTPEGYVCYRAAGPLEIDGRLDEESWRLAEPTASFVDISGRDFPKPLHDTRVKMLWDDDYLYIGARLEEKDIRARLTQRDTIIYHDNDFEVFIDPDGDGHNYFEIENNARGVVFDLMLDRPYRSGGNFMIQWDCPGLRLAVRHEGTLNDPSDTDKAWTVEMAIPRQAVALNFDNPLRAGRYWRVNFSRVQWLKPGEREENWVWQPTGKVDMHMPERWGFLYFSDKTVGEAREDFRYPYDMAAYKLLWGMFHTQNDARAREGAYLRDVENFLLTDKELSGLPADADIQVEATDDTHVITVTLPSRKTRYSVNHEGRFAVDTIAPRKVKNWVWIRLDQIKEIPDLAHYFKTLKEGGISGVMIQGYDEAIYRQCREAGLEAHYWKWTMNRKELLDTHPDWFAVNRKGESTRDNPAYVEYYRFLCPYHDGVATHIARDYVAIANLPYVSGVHLDYVRFPDVVLPVGLWKNYGIEQTRELPEYDYCYCDVCREKFKAMTGVDPMELPYPMESQSWINFRLDGITRVVDSVTRAVKLDGKRVTAAVFPGPSMARKMVRQDWGNWHLDAYYPMIYNGFYHEDAAWVARSVRESVRTVDGRAKIYAGLMFPDIKDDFEAYLDAAFDNGASGVSFFDGPDEEHLRRFKRYLDKKGLIVAE